MKMLVPVQSGDTAATIAARYTLGGPAYADALIAVNSLPPDVIYANSNLSAYGILNLEVPQDWLATYAQGRSAPDVNAPKTGLQTPVLGAPAWLWALGAFVLWIGAR